MRVDVRISDENGNVGQASIPMGVASQPWGPVSPTGSWAIVMQDDFDNGLDPLEWVVQNGRDMNGTIAKATNVSVENSMLRLQLSQEGSTVYGAMVSSALDYDAEGAGYWMDRGDAVEAMVYFPGDSAGHLFNWGGFWTSGPDWPRSGENDILEFGPDASVNYHGVTNNATGDTTQYVSNGSPTPASGWQNRWIWASLHRTADNKSKIYLDGVLMRTVDTLNHEFVDAKQALIFSLGVNGTPVLGAAGAILVDWVRAYRPA